MLDRRQSPRDKVIFGGVAAIGDSGVKRDCVVRSLSDQGASIEFRNIIGLPKDRISLTIAKKSQCFAARVIWSRDNVVGIAFSAERPAAPNSDLERQLRASEKKKLELQRRIKIFLGEA